MKIIKIAGGLGNQMFQYAFGQVLTYRSYDVLYDLRWFKNVQQHNGYELDSVFGIKVKTARWADVAKVTFFDFYLFGRHITKQSILMRMPILRYILSDGKKIIYEESPYGFENRLLTLPRDKQQILFGYYQHTGYYSKYRKQLQDIFSFPKFTEDEHNNKQISKKINNAKNAVAVHVRRGDYTQSDFIDLCNDTEYYQKAIRLVKSMYKDAHFFIFSDDARWAKDFFTRMGLVNMTFIDWNTGKSSYRDMHLMSLCRHNIIANSSFSFWGAYLNKHTNNTIVCPKYYDKAKKWDGEVFYPSEWIKL